MPAPSIAPRLGIFARMVRAVLLFLYKRRGWRAVGVPPAKHRFVMIAAPHTSNWDFPYYLGLTQTLGVHTHFMAKKSLFRWPFAGFMDQVGGVPVDRSAAKDMVDQMIAEFARRDDFVLTIAPEGTRDQVKAWRTGFYRIACGAGVPILCGYMDYATLTGGIGPIIVPTGDYDTDMVPVFAFYKSITGKHPERMTPLTAVK
jgi:1-acyl-sn-glycerol-3-phosphate acyltransferase